MVREAILPAKGCFLGKILSLNCVNVIIKLDKIIQALGTPQLKSPRRKDTLSDPFLAKRGHSRTRSKKCLVFLMVHIVICSALTVSSLEASPGQYQGAQWVGKAKSAIYLPAIAHIESSSNPSAFNKQSGCIGLYQINPKGALVDFNNMARRETFEANDMYDPSSNEIVASWYLGTQIPRYLRHYQKKYPRIKVDVKHVIWAYNCGIGCVVEGRMPSETKSYVHKYLKIVDKLSRHN